MSVPLHNRSFRRLKRSPRVNRRVVSSSFLVLLFLACSIFTYFISNQYPVSAYEVNYKGVSTSSSIATQRFTDDIEKRFGSRQDLIIDKGDLMIVKIQSVESVSAYLTARPNVESLLNELKIKSEDFIVTPSVNSELYHGATITLVKVEKKYETVVEEIPFRSESIKDSSIYIGNSVVSQEGHNGVKEIIILKTYHDGKLVDELISEVKIITPAVNQITKVGTREKIDPSTVMGINNSCVDWDSYIDQITSDEGERRWLKGVMRCESGCYAGANNSGIYKGLMQFSQRTFTGYGGTNIWDGYQQLRIALTIYRAGGASHHWPGCTKLVK